MHSELNELIDRFTAAAKRTRDLHRTFDKRCDEIDACILDDSGDLQLTGVIGGEDFGASWSCFPSHELHRDLRELIEQMAETAAHTKAAGFLPGAVRLIAVDGRRAA